MKEMVGGCCVCSDERGWPENPLVYCDGQNCTVAVHQACYGIVTVPTGPWFCRKCESQERAARVRCELCPSRDGALKKTDNLGWAHVVCALYIPEVRFGNVTTMEPIILQLIPQERYSKTCYICHEVGKGSKATVGACMQCNKSGCKQQFHVTCAQQLGLLCEEAGNYLDNVKYCGYCQHHYSKLKKGGNVKTIPPYKPVTHETVSSDPPSSPEKESETASGSHNTASTSSSIKLSSQSTINQSNQSSLSQSTSATSSTTTSSSSLSSTLPTTTSSSALTSTTSVTTSNASISSTTSSSGVNNVLVQHQSSTSNIVNTSSKQKKSSSSSKNSSSTAMSSSSSSSAPATSSSSSSSSSTPTSLSTSAGTPNASTSTNSSSITQNNNNNNMLQSQSHNINSGNVNNALISGNTNSSGTTSTNSSVGGGGSGGSSSGSNSSNTTNKEKDKHSKYVSKSSSSSNKSHDKDSKESSKSSKSKSSSNTSSLSSNLTAPTSSSTLSSSTSPSTSITSSNVQSSTTTTTTSSTALPTLLPNVISLSGVSKDSSHHQQMMNSSAQMSTPSVSSSSSTTISKDTVGHKFSTSNFNDTHSEQSVFGMNNNNNNNSNNNVNNSIVGGVGANQNLINNELTVKGSTTSVTIAKKRKADSGKISANSSTEDINKDLIKDVSVTLVPLPLLDRNDSVEEKNMKKVKMENSNSSPLRLVSEQSLQNLTSNLSSSQQQQSQLSISLPNILKQQQQQLNMQQNANLQHLKSSGNDGGGRTQGTTSSPASSSSSSSPYNTMTSIPSLVVSVPLSNAHVPGISLPPNAMSPVTLNQIQNSNQQHQQQQQQQQQLAVNRFNSLMDQHQNLSHQRAQQQQQQQQQHSQANAQHSHLTMQNNNIIPTPPQQQQPSTQHILERQSPSILQTRLPSPSTHAHTISGSQQSMIDPNHSNNSSQQQMNSGNALAAASNSLTSANVNIQNSTQNLSPSQNGPINHPFSSCNTTITPMDICSSSSSGGLKIVFEKQINTRVTQIQEETSSGGRRSRTPESASYNNTNNNNNNNSSNNSSNNSFSGLKFSYEPQTHMNSTPSVTPQPPLQVHESPPSSPGSDSKKKLVDSKDFKVFQNGIHATHMLGNQLNPSSSVAQKMSDQLHMELEAHSAYASTHVESNPQLVGPPFPGKMQHQPVATQGNVSGAGGGGGGGGTSLSSMLGGNGMPTAAGNTPQSLEQLLERQWEQGSQFLMEQAQHFDIASLLSCLHQLRTENIRLEDHVNNLISRRDHLLAVNARLAIPLSPVLPHQQPVYNNMHLNGPIETATTTALSITTQSRSVRTGVSSGVNIGGGGGVGMGHGSGGGGGGGGVGQMGGGSSIVNSIPNTNAGHNFNNQQLPLENGIDFRHTNSSASQRQTSTNVSYNRQQPNTNNPEQQSRRNVSYSQQPNAYQHNAIRRDDGQMKPS